MLNLSPSPVPNREMETLGGFGTGSEARDADGRPAGLRSRVKGVSCGGGFTLAVTNGGKVRDRERDIETHRERHREPQTGRNSRSAAHPTGVHSSACYMNVCCADFHLSKTSPPTDATPHTRPHGHTTATTGVCLGLVGPGPPRPGKASRTHNRAQEESPPLPGNASKGLRSWAIAGRSGADG